MRDVTPTASSPSRRLVTVGALGVAVAALTGCGIRLEDDAPRVPLVPDRSPIAGEEALLRLLAAVQAAALAPVDPTSPISPLLAPLHRKQASVLNDALRQRGVPEDELPSATPTPTSSSTPSPSSSPSAASSSSASPSITPSSPPPSTDVAAVENAIISAGAGCAGAAEDLRPTLLAILGQAHAAVDLVGAEPGATPQGTKPLVWTTPEVLVPLIEAVRTATYYLQVAAARSSRSVRTDWLKGIGRLERLTAELVDAVGDGAPAPDLGRPLPHPVTTPTEAATLATQALSTLLSTFGSTLRSLTDADPDAAFAVAPRWLGTVAAQARRHDVPLAAFPGLT